MDFSGIAGFFKKNKTTNEAVPQPQKLSKKQFESHSQESQRFATMHPMAVCEEVSRKIGGIATRTDPNDLKSSPIIIKEASNNTFFSVVFFKRSGQFSIYLTKNLKSKKRTPVTSRNSSHGLKMAFENIEQGKYDIKIKSIL